MPDLYDGRHEAWHPLNITNHPKTKSNVKSLLSIIIITTVVVVVAKRFCSVVEAV